MVLIFAKNLTSSFPFCFNIFLLLLYLYFNILLLLSYFLYLLYTVNQFSFTHFRYCVSTFSYKHMPQCKFSLYLKKAGLASRNIVHFLKKVILRCIGLCFHYHHLYLLSRLDQPLIQRIPAGLSSTVACLDITLQQKQPNQNTLFSRVFIGPGLVGQEEGFCSVKVSISQSE